MTQPGFWPQLKARIHSELPKPHQLAGHRWLGPIAHRLTEHGLWHAKTESVARAVAIGLFWAFLLPVAQILVAVAHCVWWRANIPVAAGITLITNPLTIGGWLWLAYQTGSLFITPDIAPVVEGWLGRWQTLGWPTVLGMALFAVGGAVFGYFGVKLFSRLSLAWRLRRRALRQRTARV
jgi:uncharacterized protein (DUF2062 family)